MSTQIPPSNPSDDDTAATPTPTVEEIGGFKAYVTGAHHHSNLAVILISHAFGFEAPTLRKIADKVAALGYLTVVPDLLYGDPYNLENPQEGWSNDHCPDKGCEDVKAVIADLKSRGVSKIGAAGFCWGGRVAVRLAKFDDLIQAAVLLHPGRLTEENINAVKVPIAILGAETDNHSPPELLRRLGDILASKSQVDSFVKIFPGVSHGWTVRYNEDDEFAVRSAEEGFSDMMDWLTKYVVG